MGTELEIRKEQKRQLMLLKSIESGEITLRQAMLNLEAEMIQEDISHVEKIAAKKRGE